MGMRARSPGDGLQAPGALGSVIEAIPGDVCVQGWIYATLML